ncbi:MAG: response regulator transcription factor [Candidatus Hydrogenedentes bacterium]|nr:response regulator transcription factor [Candidatus Hydrogenedentota bacterium]
MTFPRKDSTTLQSEDTVRAKVLIVDDHPMIRAGLVQLVSGQADLEVCGECQDAAGVVPLIDTFHPDVIVVDISLESSSGLTLIHDIKTRYKSQKMLVYSMHDEELFAVRAIQAGAMGYVKKSAHPRELIDAIRKVLQGHLAVSQRVTDSLVANMADVGPDPGRSRIDLLSSRELEVFEFLGRGLTVREIAERLNRSAKTIESHRERIMTKLGLMSSAKVVRQAVEWVTQQDHSLGRRPPQEHVPPNE